MSINSISVTGRIGSEPEKRTTSNNKDVTTFRMAVNRRGRDAEALWLTVKCWGQSADYAAQYLRKGQEVGVSGRLDVSEYQDRDGNNRTSVEIIADNVQGLDRPRDDDGGGRRSNKQEDAGFDPFEGD